MRPALGGGGEELRILPRSAWPPTPVEPPRKHLKAGVSAAIAPSSGSESGSRFARQPKSTRERARTCSMRSSSAASDVESGGLFCTSTTDVTPPCSAPAEPCSQPSLRASPGRGSARARRPAPGSARGRGRPARARRRPRAPRPPRRCDRRRRAPSSGRGSVPAGAGTGRRARSGPAGRLRPRVGSGSAHRRRTTTTVTSSSRSPPVSSMADSTSRSAVSLAESPRRPHASRTQSHALPRRTCGRARRDRAPR